MYVILHNELHHSNSMYCKDFEILYERESIIFLIKIIFVFKIDHKCTSKEATWATYIQLVTDLCSFLGPTSNVYTLCMYSLRKNCMNICEFLKICVVCTYINICMSLFAQNFMHARIEYKTTIKMPTKGFNRGIV